MRRKKIARKLGFDWKSAFLPPLTHSNNIILIDDSASIAVDKNRIYKSGGRLITTTKHIDTVYNNPKWQSGIDGIIVTVPNLIPVLLTADCAGAAFYHPPSRIFGIAHVGVIGAMNQLSKKMVYAMEELYGCNPEDIEIVLYPSIRSCHYDLSHSGAWGVISNDVKLYYGGRNQFYSNGFLDLQGFVKWQLSESGIKEEHIFDTNLCTVCHYRDFYSNFGAGTPAKKKLEGRFASIIGRRSA